MASLRLSCCNDGGHSLVEHFAEEVEPFLLGDFTVTVSIELRKEAVEGSGVDAAAFTLACSNCLELFAVDLTIAVDVELVVLTTDIFESLSSNASNFSESFFHLCFCD